MTWTWNDDDPATAASAQNFNTHIELRLRALEVAGGGGAGAAVPVDRNDPAYDGSASAYITPEDQTAGAFVTVRFQNASGSTKTPTLYCETSVLQAESAVVTGKKVTYVLLVPAGDRYAVYADDCNILDFYEQSIS